MRIVASTKLLSFQEVYEWTRVSTGLLSSANKFEKIVSVYVLNDLIYYNYEVCMDDMLILMIYKDIPSLPHPNFYCICIKFRTRSTNSDDHALVKHNDY